MRTIVWIVSGLLLGLWSLLAWGLWALLTLNPAWVDKLYAQIEDTRIGAWLNEQFSGWEAILSELLNALQSASVGFNSLLPWLIGGMWLLGAGLLLLLAGLVHLGVSQSLAQDRQNRAP